MLFLDQGYLVLLHRPNRAPDLDTVALARFPLYSDRKRLNKVFILVRRQCIFCLNDLNDQGSIEMLRLMMFYAENTYRTYPRSQTSLRPEKNGVVADDLLFET